MQQLEMDLDGFEVEHIEQNEQESYFYYVMNDLANILKQENGFELVRTELRKIGYDLDWYFKQ